MQAAPQAAPAPRESPTSSGHFNMRGGCRGIVLISQQNSLFVAGFLFEVVVQADERSMKPEAAHLLIGVTGRPVFEEDAIEADDETGAVLAMLAVHEDRIVARVG